MENQNNSVNHLAMTYGLYMGLALVLNGVIFYVNGTPFSTYSGTITYAILIGGLIMTMRAYRSSHPEEGMTYGKALGLGTYTTFFASLILSFFTFILFKIIDKTLLDKFLTFLEEQFLRSGMSESQTDTFMSMYRKLFTPLTYSLNMIFSVTFTGFVLSLIISIFLKKQSTNPFHGIE